MNKGQPQDWRNCQPSTSRSKNHEKCHLQKKKPPSTSNSTGKSKSIVGKSAPRNHKNYTIVPEWEVEEEKLLTSVADLQCIVKDHFVQAYKNDEFEKSLVDAMTLTAYKQFQAQQFADGRLDKIRRGFTTRTKVYSDEEILQEMIQTYGKMDQSSERFKLLFENYKESFLEQVQLCEEDEENIVYGLLKSGHRVVKHNFSSSSDKTREEMRSSFPSLTVEALENLGAEAESMKAEWLDVPRPKHTDGFGMSYLSRFLRRYPETVSINFCAVDPHFLNPKWIQRDENYDVGLRLAICLDEFIRKFPYGITTEIFLEKFFLKYRYHVHFKSLGFKTLSEFLENLPDIFHFVQTKHYRRTLLFSASLKPFLAPMHFIFLRMRHLVLQVIGLYANKYILTEDIPKLLTKQFGISFDCTDWGFASWNDFLQVQLECDIHDVTIESVKKADRTNELVEHFLVTDDNIDKFWAWKTLVETEAMRVLERTNLPGGFVGFYEHFITAASAIKPEDELACVISAVYTPLMMTAIPLEHWNNLEQFQRSIQNPLWSDRNCRPVVEVRSAMQPGLAVLVFCPSCDANISEWHRGVILGPGGRNLDAFRIFMVDYGSVTTATMENIRYLPDEVGPNARPNNLVFLKLKMDSVFQKYKTKRASWTRKHQRLFDSIYLQGDTVFKFLFAEKDIEDGFEFNRWTVSMSIVDKITKEIIVKDFYETLVAAFVKAGLEKDPSVVGKRKILENHKNPSTNFLDCETLDVVGRGMGRGKTKDQTNVPRKQSIYESK